MSAAARIVAVVILALVLSPAGEAYAQYPDTIRAPAFAADTGDAMLWGLIRDEGTGKPIPNMAVRIDSSNVRTLADSLGRYVIHRAQRSGRFRFLVTAGPGIAMYLRESREVILFWPDDGILILSQSGTGMQPPHRSFATRVDFWMRRRPIPF